MVTYVVEYGHAILKIEGFQMKLIVIASIVGILVVAFALMGLMYVLSENGFLATITGAVAAVLGAFAFNRGLTNKS